MQIKDSHTIFVLILGKPQVARRLPPTLLVARFLVARTFFFFLRLPLGTIHFDVVTEVIIIVIKTINDFLARKTDTGSF